MLHCIQRPIFRVFYSFTVLYLHFYVLWYAVLYFYLQYMHMQYSIFMEAVILNVAAHY